MDENDNINLFLANVCSSFEDIIVHSKTNHNKQRLYAALSFLEFVKADADIKLLPIEDNKITFMVEM